KAPEPDGWGVLHTPAENVLHMPAEKSRTDDGETDPRLLAAVWLHAARHPAQPGLGVYWPVSAHLLHAPVRTAAEEPGRRARLSPWRRLQRLHARADDDDGDLRHRVCRLWRYRAPARRGARAPAGDA